MANALLLRDEFRKDPVRWNSSLGPFYRDWAALDPVAALEAAGREGRRSVAAVMMALSGWASADPDAAADWLLSQPAGAHRDRHAAGLVQGWPGERLQELADRVAEFSADTESGTLAVRLTARWLHDDPASAASWLGGLESDDSSRRATELLFQQWGAADPTSAGEFLANNPEAANWDAAAGAYAKAVVQDDAETAALWAEAIRNPSLREQIRDVIPFLRERRGQPGPGLPGAPPTP